MSKEEILNQYESFKFTNDELDETHYYKDNVLLAMEYYATILLKAQEEKHNEEKLEYQLFIGKVSEIIGQEKVVELLEQSYKAIGEMFKKSLDIK
jgi:hypothetical protein